MSKNVRIYTGAGTHDYYDVPARAPMGTIASRSAAGNVMPAQIELPNPDPILRRLGKSIEVYSDLLSDARVGSNVDNRQSGLLSQEWQVERGDASTKVADAISDIMSGLKLADVIPEMLDATLYGYKPVEVMWERDGRHTIPSALVGKPPEWFMFDAENHLRFRSRSDRNGLDLTLPQYRYKFLLPRHKATYNNPYGRPLLALTFWYVQFKRGGLRFWVTFTEKYGMPFTVGRYRQGADQKEKDQLLVELANMVQDAVAVVPDGTGVEIVEHKGGTGSAMIYEKLLRYCDEQSSIAILGHPGTSMSTPGKLGNDNTAVEVRKDLVDSDKRLVESTINTLIRWIVDINFGDNTPAPLFSIYEAEEVDTTRAERDDKLSQNLDRSGLRLSRKYYQSRYNLGDDDIENTPSTPPAQFSAANRDKSLSQPKMKSVASGDTFDHAARNDPQADVDALADAIPAEQLQAAAEQMLAPLIDYVQNADSLEAVRDHAAELFPALDSSALEQIIERAMFVAAAWGRIHGGEG